MQFILPLADLAKTNDPEKCRNAYDTMCRSALKGLLKKNRIVETQESNVVFFKPAKLVAANVESLKNNEEGLFVTKDTSLLESLRKVPVLFFLHGGGLTLGNAHQDTGIDLLLRILEAGDIILASAHYRLAPEHKYPCGHENIRKPASLCFDRFDSIHLCGLSAGAYYATAVLPQFSFASCTLQCPMLRPRHTDSLSYQLNARSSRMCPVPYLKWCWKSYLPLGCEAVPHCPIEPLSLMSSFPKDIPYLVCTNRVDPLYDDGKFVVDHLECQKLEWVDALGSHWGRTMFEQVYLRRVVDVMRTFDFDD